MQWMKQIEKKNVKMRWNKEKRHIEIENKKQTRIVTNKHM